MRIAVCDDSAFDRALLVELLQQHLAQRSLPVEIVQYDNGVNLLCDMEEEAWFDIVFLDIYMNDVLGIDVARKLRALRYNGEIIFLTASSDFAVDSYDVAAAGYLLKPISVEKLCLFVDRIIQNFDANTYQVRNRSKVVRIPFREILFVESSNSKCILHREGGESYTIYKRLGEIELELTDPRFLRCHQSFLVNMDFIQRMEKQFLLTTGDTVLVRQHDLRSIRQTYLDYVAHKGSVTG